VGWAKIAVMAIGVVENQMVQVSEHAYLAKILDYSVNAMIQLNILVETSAWFGCLESLLS